MKKAFVKFLESKDYSELKALWNEYASDQNMDDYIFEGIEDYAELTGENGVELARKVFFGNIQNWGDDVYLNGYGNFMGCWSVESSPIDLDVLAEWLEENHATYEEWKNNLQTFSEWLDDNYSRPELIAMWGEYVDEDTEDYDLDLLAETIEEADGDEYLDYVKIIFE